MAKIYQDLGRTSTLAVNAIASPVLWTLDLSSITGDALIIEVTTSVYDPLNDTCTFYYAKTGIYKNASATVANYSAFLQESDYQYNGGDSVLSAPVYNQATNELSQVITISQAGSRTLQFTYVIKVVAM